MARPPQFERPEDLTCDATAVKVAIKHLSPKDRAQLVAWILHQAEEKMLHLVVYDNQHFVFANEVGEMLDLDSVSKAFSALATEVGIKVKGISCTLAGTSGLRKPSLPETTSGGSPLC
jgi:hypothetical protein